MSFPAIAIEGGPIQARKYVEPGTGLAMFGAVIVGILGLLIGTLVTYGIMLLIMIFSPLIAWVLRKKAMAMIHGSGIHVSQSQFPEIQTCVDIFKSRLGMKKDVDVYIVEANVVNALAVRYGKRNVILLTDDLIHGCLASGNPQALSFVLGHELAHIALNHNGVFRAWVSQHLRKLGRLDEYSADAVATALVGDRAIAFRGLLLLTVGYALLEYVNIESVVRQAQEVAANRYSKKAERTLTHPLLLNRLNRILKMA